MLFQKKKKCHFRLNWLTEAKRKKKPTNSSYSDLILLFFQKPSRICNLKIKSYACTDTRAHAHTRLTHMVATIKEYNFL